MVATNKNRHPKTHQRAKKKRTRGPKPDTLKIEGDWRDAVKKSLERRKPAGGWPL